MELVTETTAARLVSYSTGGSDFAESTDEDEEHAEDAEDSSAESTDEDEEHAEDAEDSSAESTDEYEEYDLR
jgi:hypothetical protein